tara:strand:- start:904 stop:1224 length:321 start_codon:yes stop_codon:yes gene_type:complete
MYKKLTKKTKILNILKRGSVVTWKQLKTTYNLKSPRAMIDTIRRDGFCVYANKDSRGNTFYRIGKPSGAIIKAGVAKISKMSSVTFDNIVAAGVREVLGTKFAYTS